jgi:hypothetical protein
MTTNGEPKEIQTTSTVQEVVETYHDVAVLCEGSCESPLAYLEHGCSERVLQASACFTRILETFSLK